MTTPSRRSLRVLSGGASLACALALGMPHQAATSSPQIVRDGLESVPLGAQGIVSAALEGDSGAFAQQGELSDSPGARGEEFGEAVAVSGRTLVVGTIHHIDASTDLEPGAAYVFTEPASGWAHAK